MLKNLLNAAPKTEPHISIYENYLVLNQPAMVLLGLQDGGAVSVMQDDRDGYIYIANNPEAKVAYGVRKKQNRGEVSNAELCRKLRSLMEGKGTYRICQEESVDFMNHRYYNIFAKKYGKD